MINWISEESALPHVGEVVLRCHPRQFEEFWNMDVAQLLIRHEGVIPIPVPRGSKWPIDYYWCRRGETRSTSLVTGNGWWARFEGLPLPPMAEHRRGRRGEHYIAQTGEAFIPRAMGYEVRE
jgi:hypothetical protein